MGEEDPEYFIGSLITIEKSRHELYEVVDGQQRLTTLNLIFARLRDHVEDAAAKQKLGERILPVDPLDNSVEEPRLSLRSADNRFFRRYVLESEPIDEAERTELDETKQRILLNLECIDSFLAEREQDWMKKYASFILSKVYVVLVTTESFQSAYRLFNVLNDRGLSLSNADLIKNQLFASLKDSSKSEELEEKWVDLENITGVGLLDTFLGYHRTALVANKARKSLADEYLSLISQVGGDPLKFVDDMTRSAKHFRRLKDNKEGDPRTKRSIAALWRVSYDEWVPTLLAYLNQPVDGIALPEFADLLERITMQNWVRRLGRTQRLTVYYQVINVINRNQGAEALLQVFRDGANNEEFIALLQGDVYGRPSARAILLRLEEATQDESVTKEFGGRITIEHVLPQSLKDPYWVERFTPEEHQKWIHRLGNLMPLSGNKNYSAQNFAFDRKKSIFQRRNEKVSFDLAKEVCDSEEWTLAALESRQARMIDLAVRIWSIS